LPEVEERYAEMRGDPNASLEDTEDFREYYEEIKLNMKLIEELIDEYYNCLTSHLRCYGGGGSDPSRLDEREQKMLKRTVTIRKAMEECAHAHKKKAKARAMQKRLSRERATQAVAKVVGKALPP